MKFGTDIDNNEQWLNKVKSFSLSNYSTICNNIMIA